MERGHAAEIEAKGLRFKYMDHYVLDGLDLLVKKGSFTGIIGPNGSGKTTLLKCLTKLLPPEAGSCWPERTWRD